MGYYINPRAGTKEGWLNDHGLEVTGPEWGLLATNFRGAIGNRGNDGVYVCLVDNGPFTAAGICYNEAEFDAFNAPGDSRPMTWYVVMRGDIIDVCPQVEEKLEI